MKKIKASEFDKAFDAGKSDIIHHLDTAHVRRPNLRPKRVNVDFPTWMVSSLDQEASRLGITRQSLIKTWLNEKLESRH